MFNTTCKFPAACKYPTQQQLRAMALRAQLLAVDAQASALDSMDREHSLGVEAGHSIDQARKAIHDFVKDVLAFAENVEGKTPETNRSEITVLARRAADLKSQCDAVKETGKHLAQLRFSRTDAAAVVPKEVATAAPAQADKAAAEAGPADVTDYATPTNDTLLQIKADFACLRAEMDEYAALALQVHALCNLALEFCFNAAVKCAMCS